MDVVVLAIELANTNAIPRKFPVQRTVRKAQNHLVNCKYWVQVSYLVFLRKSRRNVGILFVDFSINGLCHVHNA